MYCLSLHTEIEEYFQRIPKKILLMNELPGPEMSFLTLVKVKTRKYWQFDDNLYNDAQGFCFLLVLCTNMDLV